MKPYKIEIILEESDFEQSMGRKPLNQEEFDEWVYYAEKGLLNGHIDWNIIYDCTKDAMPSLEDVTYLIYRKKKGFTELVKEFEDEEEAIDKKNDLADKDPGYEWWVSPKKI